MVQQHVAGNNPEPSVRVPPSTNIGPFLLFVGIAAGGVEILFATVLLAVLTGSPVGALIGFACGTALATGFGVLCFHSVPKLHLEAIDILSMPVSAIPGIPYVHLGQGPTFIIPGVIGTTRFSEEDQPLDIRYAPAEKERLPQDDDDEKKSVFYTASLATYCRDRSNIVVIREVQIRYRVLNPHLALRIQRQLRRILYSTIIARLVNEIRRRTLQQILKSDAKVQLRQALEEELDAASQNWGIDITSITIADPGQLPETEAARQIAEEALALQQRLGLSPDGATRAALANRGKATVEEKTFEVGGKLGGVIERVGGSLGSALGNAGAGRRRSIPVEEEEERS